VVARNDVNSYRENLASRSTTSVMLNNVGCWNAQRLSATAARGDYAFAVLPTALDSISNNVKRLKSVKTAALP